MMLRFEHQGRTVMTVDLERLTRKERKLVERLAVDHPVLQAASAECDAEFCDRWAVGSVEGMYRRSERSAGDD